MNSEIRKLLESVRSGETSVEDAMLELKKAPFEDIGYAKVDLHRKVRQGAAEVIYGAGKTPEQIGGIIDAMRANGQNRVLITRMSPEAAAHVGSTRELDYHKDARVGIVGGLPQPDGIGKVVIATGGTTGTYYAVGNALVTTIGDKLSLSKLTAVDSGASKANVQLVTANQAQMSILQSDVLNYAHNGSGGETMFDGAADKNSLWVAGVYNETVQLVTAPSITSIEDLKGKTVCVGDVGSGTALNAAQVLEAYGMTFDDIKVMYDSFSGGAEALKNGQCDAAFTVSGAPTPALTDLATAYNFNMPSLSDEAVSYLTTNYPFLVQDNLPANTYTCVADETVCVAVKAVFTASKDLSEDVVYEITKAMFDNQADLAKAQAKFGYLSPEGAVAGSFDLHPGAEKYYKEIGVL